MKLSVLLFSTVAILCLLSPHAYAEDSGASLFKADCLMCHGADGRGTPTGKAFKVVDFHDPAVMKMSDADMVEIIGKGKNNMPAFGARLTSPEIESLVSYIRTLQK